MEIWGKIWKWIDHNRFIVIAPTVALVIWLVAIGCVPLTPSPLNPNNLVNAKELGLEYRQFVARYEFAGQDLQEQAEQQTKFFNVILELASGNVADLPGLLQLLLYGGFAGPLTDNIRKRGLISGLKKNE